VRLKDKVAIVTGAASGIGRSVAQVLARKREPRSSVHDETTEKRDFSTLTAEITEGCPTKSHSW
jgi:NAD(P)-dependent dehydrogenase (short-subunit alcohol dehydrogenase family)